MFPVPSFPGEKKAGFGAWFGSSHSMHPAFTERRCLDGVEIAAGFEFVNVGDAWEGELHALVSLWL